MPWFSSRTKGTDPLRCYEHCEPEKTQVLVSVFPEKNMVRVAWIRVSEEAHEGLSLLIIPFGQ